MRASTSGGWSAYRDVCIQGGLHLGGVCLQKHLHLRDGLPTRGRACLQGGLHPLQSTSGGGGVCLWENLHLGDGLPTKGEGLPTGRSASRGVYIWGVCLWENLHLWDGLHTKGRDCLQGGLHPLQSTSGGCLPMGESTSGGWSVYKGEGLPTGEVCIQCDLHLGVTAYRGSTSGGCLPTGGDGGEWGSAFFCRKLHEQ